LIKKFEKQLLVFVQDKYPQVFEMAVKKDGLTDELDQLIADVITEFKTDFVKKNVEV